MRYLEEVKKILADTLYLGERKHELSANTILLGNIPELDSMAVVSVIACMEERLGIVVEDDEISADTFETVGALASFVEQKLVQ